ncbi:hypothetical protein IQ06DRAFT_303138 [Phaeosphaeriaceae sp. SRC1lsM3a]|nr:hypothetical protein IQ06DRAFT_303138 [Stagonospora sp. SRC1lsM3a]
MDPAIRATRPPPSRRALFHASTRRQAQPSVVRPDTATIFQQPMEDELVERDEKGQYKINTPSTMYKHLAMGMGRESDEEAEHENAVIDMYGKPNPAWDQAAVEEEIKSAIKSSLSKKVASLQEDRWMFEGSKEQH